MDAGIQEMFEQAGCADALIPERTTRTTPRDMADLLRLIWSDHAGPPQACHRLGKLMRHQPTKHRLAAAFPPPVRVSAKSGSLVGVIRNEIGVIEYPDGRGYAAAVFAQAHRPWQDDAAINAAIGTTAAAAIGMLHGWASPVSRSASGDVRRHSGNARRPVVMRRLEGSVPSLGAGLATSAPAPCPLAAGRPGPRLAGPVTPGRGGRLT
jgi:hypothetical protein